MGRQITVPAVPAQTLQEEIVGVQHTLGKQVIAHVAIGVMVDTPMAIPGDTPMTPKYKMKSIFTMAKNEVQGYTIEGEDYDELMSAGPSWAPGKKAGKFQPDDLWLYIDKQRAAQ